MAIIENIRALDAAGVLAKRTAKTPTLKFRRFNLIYGFNGSGKSTASRLFASLQRGARHDRLPPACTFEFALDDGTAFSCPDQLNGLQQRVLVFNADFVENNLQWATGTASPVFYIGQEQAELAARLSAQEAALPIARQKQSSSEELLKSADKALTTFKRERARLVAEHLRWQGRKYEAPQLVSDFETLNLGSEAALSDEALDAVKAACRLDEPMPSLRELRGEAERVSDIVHRTRNLASETPGSVMIEELEQHPDMVLWTKQGAEYHAQHDLSNCLFCTGPITADRRALLGAAFDDNLERFLDILNRTHSDGLRWLSEQRDLPTLTPPIEALSPELREAYRQTRGRLEVTSAACARIMSTAVGVLAQKLVKPTQPIATETLASEAELIAAIAAMTNVVGELNGLLRAHNELVDGFVKYKEEAGVALRRHFLAGALEDYRTVVTARQSALTQSETDTAAHAQLVADIAQLRSEVREHGPAAEKINKLITSYLGHGELTISAVAEGYEIHRHGRLVEGAPSEGEKTAIALCYFISTLESDGRKLKDLIVIVDDPISSLDTKALNFACALVKSRLEGAAQLFVLTHNQHCMNEFKKAWKYKQKPQDKDKDPTATFLFIDVSIPKGSNARVSNFVELSKLLREYDFEYHFLFHHVLKFEADPTGDFEYAYMMPNVLRRVLDVFLAFRCPGSAGFASKLGQLCTEFPTLDKDRVTALERLTQVESHSDSLDDLITFSSMNIEETKDANGTLLYMMQVVDPAHLNHLRRICA